MVWVSEFCTDMFKAFIVIINIMTSQKDLINVIGKSPGGKSTDVTGLKITSKTSQKYKILQISNRKRNTVNSSQMTGYVISKHNLYSEGYL